MALTKYKLGDLIELCDERNTEGIYTLEDVKGISIQKMFIETKANMEGVSLNPYILVNPDYFCYVTVTSRNGEKITIAHNNTVKTYIVSSSYNVFRVKEVEKLLSQYLFMFFNRPEFDRYSRFNSWGSARETFSWEDFCDTEIELPSLDVQKQYAAVYQTACDNLNVYQSRLDSLKTVCDGYIDKIKHIVKHMKISDLLEAVDERNVDKSISEVKGINISKDFMPSVANIDEKSIRNYKIVKKGQFAFSGMQTGRDKCIRIALNKDDKSIIISPAYTTLKVKNYDVEADYIMILFSRKESDRYGWFASDGSVRSNLDLDRFFDIEVPIPSIDIQRDIVNIYQCYIKRQRIAAQMKEQIKALCPVLIRGSLQE
jgi:type I restriction enzyme S subunit